MTSMSVKQHKWILIVDDHGAIRNIMRERLLRHLIDFELKIVEAHDGLQACRKMLYQAFDLIITDMKVPKKTGADFLHVVQGSQINASTPLIVLTDRPDELHLDNRLHHIQVLKKPLQWKNFLSNCRAQLELGKVHSRIPAFLLNPFIETAETFATQLGLHVRQELPVVKRPHADMLGDVLGVLYLEIGGVRHHFVLGFEQSLLDFISSRLFKDAKYARDKDRVTREICQEIYKHTCDIISSHLNVTTQLNGIEIFRDHREPGYLELKRTRGLTIPIRTEQGVFFVEAIAGVKVIKAQAA